MSDPRAPQYLEVYEACHLRVVNGVNLDDAMSFADEILPDDIYRLSPRAALAGLQVEATANQPFRIAAGSTVGTPGAALWLDCCATFMSGDGATTEVLVLVETDSTGDVAQVLLLPLAPLRPRADYVLISVNRAVALARFAQLACMSFTRGTMITLATGAQKPVEALVTGDRVLTRDDGPQPIRWIGQTTTRAVGAFAPICIAARTLNNADDLLVSPDHRLFVYQRRDHLGAGRAEVLVRARHLVNGDTITRREGGFVDYFQMLFDRHQIIYAQGIAAESMLVDTRTQAAVPQDMTDRLMTGHSRSDAGALEVHGALLNRPDAAEVLRRSSGH